MSGGRLLGGRSGTPHRQSGSGCLWLSIERAVLPNRTRIVWVGLLLAAGTAVAAAVLAEGLDTSFHTAAELRAFSRVPVLASIPRIVTPRPAGRLLGQLRLVSAVGLGLALAVGASYLVAHDNQDLVLMLMLARP